MLNNEIDLILEKYKTVKATDEDAIDVKKSDLNKDGKLSGYEIARGKAIDKATGGDGKLADESEETKTEKAPDLLSKQKKKLDSFEKYKLSQAKRYLKNIKTFNKIMSHMSGINEKDARKCIKKYS
jgi:hypothetical protein